MKTETYQDMSGFGKTGQSLKSFGEQQNALNAQLAVQMDALAQQLGQALDRIAQLEAEQQRAAQRFEKYAAELDALQKEVDRLRLTTKLNSNTIDRLAKGGADEA